MKPAEPVVRDRFLFVLGALAIGGGCVNDASTTVRAQQRQSVELVQRGLYGDVNNYWRDVSGNAPGNGQRVDITVCWEPVPASPPAPALMPPDVFSLDDVRRWAQEAVRRSWSRYARVNFLGWGTCTPGQAGVHIQLINGNGSGMDCFNPNTNPNEVGPCSGVPMRTATGRLISGRTNGMRLGTWSGTGCTGTGCRDGVYGHAVHEFGHALGFYHDEERPGFTGTLPTCGNTVLDGGQPPVSGHPTQTYGALDGTSVGGVWVSRSIMGACANVGGLSPNDIASVQKAYGRRQSGSVVTQSAYCLSAHAFTPGQSGARPNVWDCDEFMDGQEWRYSSNSELTVRPNLSPNSTAKLTGFAAAGAQVEIRDGFPSGGRWTMQTAKIRGFGGLCMDLWGGDQASGVIRMFNCALAGPIGNPNPPGGNGNLANQQWRVMASAASSSGEIRFAGNQNMCLTVNSNVDSTPLLLRPCDGTANQQFTLHSSGDIRIHGKCLNVRGPREDEWLTGTGTPAPGSDVEIWACANVIAQKWNLTGPVVNTTSGRCLDYGSEGNGLVPWTDTCHGQIWQELDVYFKN
jgi:hypothetical protein